MTTEAPERAVSERRLPRPPRVVIAGGGTGGHLYPGLAVARELRRRYPGAQVTFAGTAHGIEARVLPHEGWSLDTIRSRGLKGKSLGSRLRGAFVLPLSFGDAWRVISRRRPHVVVGVGGYSSGPVVLVAALRGVPTMVLEQNAKPGLTNRLLARWIRAAAVTYAEARPFFRGKAFVSGNPVRPEFLAGDTPLARAEGSRELRVLTLGGSQGAHAINVAMVAAAAELVRRRPGMELVHQTGERDIGWAREEYERLDVPARAEPYLDAMADEMRAADVVVGRAGATTLAELAAAGRPPILVPFSFAADDHQRANATVLAEAGAALVIDERELTGPRLAEAVDALLADPARREAMGQAIRRFARPDAAARIVDRLVLLVGAGQ